MNTQEIPVIALIPVPVQVQVTDLNLSNGVFSSPNQCYDIIRALLKCVYWFKLVSHVSNVAHGPLVNNATNIYEVSAYIITHLDGCNKYFHFIITKHYKCYIFWTPSTSGTDHHTYKHWSPSDFNISLTYWWLRRSTVQEFHYCVTFFK